MRNPTSISQLIPNVSAGLIQGLIHVIISVSFASLIFTGHLQQFLPQGIAIALATSAIATWVIGILSPPLGFIGILQDNPTVLMNIGISAIVVTLGPGETLLPTILAFMLITTLLTGITLFLLGQFKVGSLIRYIPYPVIAGFMAGTGWLLVIGALNTMTNMTITLNTLPALFSPEQLGLWLPGVIFGLLLFIGVQRIQHFLAMPALILGGFVIFYVFLFITGLDATTAAAEGLLLGNIGGAATWQPFPVDMLLQADWGVVFAQVGSIGTVILLTSIQVLLNISGLELLIQKNVDFDRELRTTGILNITSGFGGGLIGFHSTTSTALVRSLSGRGRLPSLITGAVCASMLIFGTDILQFFPKAILGGLLVFLGLDFLSEWVWQGWHKFNKIEYSVVIIILFAIATIGFLEGVGIGLLLMVFIFVWNYSRINIFHHTLSGAQAKSNVERNAYHQRTLVELGEHIHIIELRGFLFFGTANTLLQHIEARLADTTRPDLRHLILDFRRISGIDSSASLVFTKVKYLAETNDFTLVFTSLKPAVRRELANSDLAKNEMIFDDLDHGLEWCENDLLEQEQITRVNIPATLQNQLENFDFSPSETEELRDYLEMVQLKPGETLIQQGALSSELYFIEIGRVSVYLAINDDKQVRMQSYSLGTIVGEIGFYLKAPRSASVIADLNTIAYRITDTQLQAMQADNPALAASFHALIARVVAERLHNSDLLVAALNQ